jgi:hypothetical protein
MHFLNLAIFSRIGRGPARPPIRGAAIRGENPFALATFPHIQAATKPQA